MSDCSYEVRVSGLVPTQQLLAELTCLERAEQQFHTVFCGRFPDQAALYGLLHRLRAYGLDVVEVRRVPSGQDATAFGGAQSQW